MDLEKSLELSLRSMVVKWWLVRWSVGVDRWMGLTLVWITQWFDGLIGDSGGDWWFDLFMWVSDCRSSWLVGGWVYCWFGLRIARYFLGVVLLTW